MSTSDEERTRLSYYRTAEEIRSQEFSHRMRGFDEYEVREFLDLWTGADC